MDQITSKKSPPKRLRFTEKSVAAIAPPADRPQVVWWDTELTGFGVVVSRTGSRSFIVEGRVDGRKTRKVIGVHGRVRKDGNTWNVARARKSAKERLGQMAAGEDPNREKRVRRNGPTLRDALELKVENMRKTGGKGGKNVPCSKRSIDTIENDVKRHLKAWLDKPLIDITPDALEAVYKRILGGTTARKNSVNPPGRAVVSRLEKHVNAIWKAADTRWDLPTRSPAKRLVTAGLEPKKNRIPGPEMPGWLAKVLTLSPVRRDVQLVALFTGGRSGSVRAASWEDVDFERGVLHFRRAKGNAPYSVPLGPAMLDLLKRRQKANAIDFEAHGGDHGWVFPSLTRSRPFRVQPVAEVKEYRLNKSTGEREQYLPGLHPLRKTFNSIAMEAGVGKRDRELLMNHDSQGVNVKHYGFPDNWSRLAEVQTLVETTILERLGVTRDELLAKIEPSVP